MLPAIGGVNRLAGAAKKFVYKAQGVALSLIQIFLENF
jgi:hypothetical protein